MARDLNEAILAFAKVAEETPTDPIDVVAKFNADLAKLLQRLKKDAGAETLRMNYKGTGSQRFRRQLWVRFKSGAVIDLWLEKDRLQFGGIMRAEGKEGGALLPKAVPYGSDSPEEVYKKVAPLLKEWAN